MLTHKIIGAHSVRTRVLRAAAEIQNALRDTEGAASLVVDRVKRRFLAQVDPTGRAWLPLSPETKARRARSRIGPGKGILYHSGQMYESIQRIRSGGYALSTGFGFRVGVSGDQAKKARVHQYGAGRVPQRKFLGVNDLDVRSVTAYLKRKVHADLRDV